MINSFDKINFTESIIIKQYCETKRHRPCAHCMPMLCTWKAQSTFTVLKVTGDTMHE